MITSELKLTQNQVKRISDIRSTSVEPISEIRAVEIFMGWQEGQVNFVTLSAGTSSNPRDGMIIRIFNAEVSNLLGAELVSKKGGYHFTVIAVANGIATLKWSDPEATNYKREVKIDSILNHYEMR